MLLTAANLFLRSAEGGVAEANYYLGQLYETGEIGFIDTEKVKKVLS